MKKQLPVSLIKLGVILLLVAAPTCYFIAEQNNPNDLKNLNEYMGLSLADTGQTLCYNDSASIPCGGDPNYLRQDADYPDKPNARSFTGPTQHPVYTGNYTTKDNLTGLVWKSCTEGWDGANCENDNADPNIYPWDSALTACTELNNLNSGAGYAGLTTWRLPTVQELKTIINYGISNPSVDTVSFPGTQALLYWTSSTYINVPDNAWYINFYQGIVNSNNDKSNSYCVRCVSNGL